MTDYVYPARMGRILRLGAEEVLGSEGMRAVQALSSSETPSTDADPDLDKPFPFKEVTRLQESLEQVYGPLGGRGTALRIGRACFQYGLREYGSMLGVTGMTFRLLPYSTKIHIGAKSLAELFNQQTDQRVRVEESGEKVFWHIERCPLCWERQATKPVCHLAVGLLQEALYWLSGGKLFNIEESACIARGDPTCTMVIDRLPLA